MGNFKFVTQFNYNGKLFLCTPEDLDLVFKTFSISAVSVWEREEFSNNDYADFYISHNNQKESERDNIKNLNWDEREGVKKMLREIK